MGLDRKCFEGGQASAVWVGGGRYGEDCVVFSIPGSVPGSEGVSVMVEHLCEL